MSFGVLGESNPARFVAWVATDGWALPTSLVGSLLADRLRTRPFGPQTGGADLRPAALPTRPFLGASHATNRAGLP